MLEVRNITVRYERKGGVPDTPALSGVSFSLQKGERVALTGNNGAGKSTLLVTLMGILIPEQGEIVLDGIPLCKSSVTLFRRHIGLVMQNPDDQLFMPAVYDDIAFGPRNHGIPETEIEKKIDTVMNALGISALKEKLTHRLSGGEKRLSALAGILVMEPDIMLFDEPAAFLDPPARQRLTGILAALPQAMIIATHDLEMTRTICTRTLHLEKGLLRSPL